MSTLHMRRAAVLLAVMVAALPHASPASTYHPPTIATFSVAAYNPATGEVGVAVQSRFFAVGSVVPWARSGVGAVASQAYGNPTYGPRILDLLSAGVTPADAVRAALRDDKDAARRQIGAVSVRGEVETYTGDGCMAWAGGRTGTAPDGVVYAVQGNILAGEAVVKAMAAAMDDPAHLPEKQTANEQQALAITDFAGRLLHALLAGEAAGGDSRGMQSAALLVCQAGMGYGGYNDVKYDLRVDDAVDPFDELARLLNLARPFAMTNEAYLKLYSGDHDGAITMFIALIELQPDEASHHYNLACALSLADKLDEALTELRVALTRDEKLKPAALEDPDLAALRETDGFKELAKTIGSEPKGTENP